MTVSQLIAALIKQHGEDIVRLRAVDEPTGNILSNKDRNKPWVSLIVIRPLP